MKGKIHPAAESGDPVHSIIRGAVFRQGFRVSAGDPGVSPDIVQEGATPRMEKIPDYPVRVQVAPVRICNVRKGKATDAGRMFGELFKKLIDVAHRDSHDVIGTFDKGQVHLAAPVLG
jgi:hypothetical protein